MIRIKSIKDSQDKIKDNQKETPKIKVKAKIGWKWVLIFIFVLFFGGIAGVLADSLLIPYITTLPRFEKYQFLKPKTRETVVKEKETIKISESEEIFEAVKKVKPAVVGIMPKEEIEKSKTLFLKSENQGAGFIVTSDGLIVSNKKIISDPNKAYIIVTGDGVNYESKEIFLDPSSDLVFVKVEADNLPVVSFGVSDDLALGQKIIVLGNNLSGFQNFVSHGIISDLNSSYQSGLVEENLDEVILHDAVANFKNFGGPVLDLSGKICGVNMVTEKEGKTIVYAMPVDLIKKPMDDVIKNKKIERPKMGIRYITITPNFAKIKNLSKNYGIYLPEDEESVILESSAFKAGLRKGDIIFAIGGKEIKEKQSFFKLMQDYKVGDEVEVGFSRDKKEYKTKVKLEE